jgi:AcrR family transcriptional regulator
MSGQTRQLADARPAHVVQLPRGKHGLSREQVLTSQRMRMFDAMATAAAEKGYVNVSVADVIKRAGVSRETFYEHFANKQACFLAAYEAGVDLMLGSLAQALEGAPDNPIDRLDHALGAYLEVLASQPAIARTALIEIYAVGPAAFSQRARLQRRFVDTLTAIVGANSEPARFACEAFVGAVSSLVSARIADGDIDGLRNLRGKLVDLVRQAIPGLVAQPGGAAPS